MTRRLELFTSVLEFHLAECLHVVVDEVTVPFKEGIVIQLFLNRQEGEWRLDCLGIHQSSPVRRLAHRRRIDQCWDIHCVDIKEWNWLILVINEVRDIRKRRPKLSDASCLSLWLLCLFLSVHMCFESFDFKNYKTLLY